MIPTVTQATKTSKAMKKTFLMKISTNKLKLSPKPLAKVVQTMKKLQALYNDDANKIIEEAMQDKAIENSNFLDLAMVRTDTMPVPEEPTTFAKAWNHPNSNSHAKWPRSTYPNCQCFAAPWVSSAWPTSTSYTLAATALSSSWQERDSRSSQPIRLRLHSDKN